jgi:valyl-tRNA synthetase
MALNMQRLVPYKNAIVFWKQFGKGRKDMTITHELDKWILYEINYLIANVTQHMNHYNVKDAVSSILVFVNKLCNKYVRFMRDHIRENGSGILWNVLATFTKILTPFAPFMTESINKELENDIHPLQMDWPVVDNSYITQYDGTLINTMLDLIENVRQLRDKARITIKKPITHVHLNIPEINNDDIVQLFMKETNVMNVVWGSDHIHIAHEDTPEVINEYMLRMVNREVCNLRKRLGLIQADKVDFRIEGVGFMEFVGKNRVFFDKLFGTLPDSWDESKLLGYTNITVDGIRDGIVYIYR